MQTNIDDEIEKNIMDIQKVFPGQLVITSRQFSQLRNKSGQTLLRERKRCVGPEYKDENGSIEYPIRKIAAWMVDTVKTA